jgi:WD40 repeat protein
MFLLRGHKGELGDHSLTFSPDGRLLASGAMDGKVKVWDLGKRRSKLTFSLSEELVTGVGFVQGGAALVTSDWDGLVRVWDLATRKRRRLAKYGWLDLNCLAVTADGATVATAGSIEEGGAYRIARLDLSDDGRSRPILLGDHDQQIGYLAFLPTARCWPPAAPTARRGSGTWPRARSGFAGSSGAGFGG